MNGKYRVVLLAATFAAAAVSAESNPGQSVVIQAPQGEGYEHLTTLPAEPTLGDRCIEMARELDSLEGKPQRRAALAERYRQECQLR